MENRIHVSIFTPDGKKLDKMAEYVSVPAESGSLGVLPGHLAMLCSVVRGEMLCRSADNGETRMLVESGIVSVRDDEVSFLVAGACECE